MCLFGGTVVVDPPGILVVVPPPELVVVPPPELVVVLPPPELVVVLPPPVLVVVVVITSEPTVMMPLLPVAGTSVPPEVEQLGSLMSG